MSQTIYPVGQIVILRAHQIVRSKQFNVRTKKEKTSEKYKTGIRTLAALLKAEGILQNLVGFQQKKNKKWIDVVEVCAGGRRTDAVEWLIENKAIDPATFEIPVLICTVEDAIAKSLAENSGREALPPADQFRAFQAMKEAGRAVEEIATAWGVDEITINRRLKLANVSPRLFELYEDGDATLDQLMALALTDDHKTQEQVWDSLPQHNRTHAKIRSLITTQAIDTKNSPIARFVGLKAYEEAGGAVTRDLFSDADDGFMNDPALLESLAVKILEEKTPDLKSRWAWVDYMTTYDQYSSKFERAPNIEIPFTEEQQAAYDALGAEIQQLVQEVEALEESTGEEFTDEESEKLDQLNEKIYEMERQQSEMVKHGPDPSLAGISGAIVTINHKGELQIFEGLIRPEDKSEMKRAQAIEDAKNGTAQEPDSKPKAVHSERLIKQLTAHRTAALQAELIVRPNTALVVLAHAMTSKIFDFGGGSYMRRPETALQISLSKTDLGSLGDDVKASQALQLMVEQHQEWQDRIPTKPADLLGWLFQQEQAVILELIAFCTACTIDTVQGDEGRSDKFNELANAVTLDMANWWEPTKDTYFAQVSKQHTISLVASHVSADMVGPLSELKKIPLCEAAEKEMRGKRWLPDVLKVA
jgi:ParB family chromosome partitioning protein